MNNKIRKSHNTPRAPWIMTLFIVQVLALLLLMGSHAHAHGVYIFAWVEGNTVYTDSYFSSKKKVKEGVVKVFDSSGTILLEGKTDDNGEFSFKIPGKAALRLVLETGTGHRGEFLLKADEIAGIEDAPEPSEKSDDLHRHSTAPSQEDRDQIREVVEDALDSRLKPITRALAKIQQDQGPGLTEVIGGIGYIMGIMGIILYFRAKKKS